MSYKTLTGITLIKDGNKLGYPYEYCIKSLAGLCDEVIVNCGLSDDRTDIHVRDLETESLNKIRVLDTVWNMSNTGNGSELAKQANIILPFITSDWVLYLQADELIHEKDFKAIRDFINNLPDHITQVELFRTYFWKNLQTRVPEYEIWLGRLFKTGTHEVGGDGMYIIRHNGDVIRSPFYIYHYSRIGSEQQVTKRLRRLDSLFHDKEIVDSFKDFSYTEDLPSSGTISYSGTHPNGIELFYSK